MSWHLSKTDQHLLGQPRKRNKPIETSTSTSLAFSSTLSSLLSASNTSSTTQQARPRPSKAGKEDIFKRPNKGNVLKRAAKDLEGDDNHRSQVGKQDIGGVDEARLHRSKRKLEQKARLYAAMKRGDVVPRENEPESLIEWDRKWAENGEREFSDSGSDDGGDSDVDRDEEVEYEDEFGRLRKGTRKDVERMERKKRNALLGQEELERMSARPKMPENLIYGPTVQVTAFNPDDETTTKIEALARKRDRSPTPPPATHYDASGEIRSRGVGFYQFSKDEKMREEEMENLEKERLLTEKIRNEKEAKKEARKKEIEARRREVLAKRAKKEADSFLDGLAEEVIPKIDDAVEAGKQEKPVESL